MFSMEAVFQKAGEIVLRNTLIRSAIGLGYTVKTSDVAKPLYQHVSGFILSLEDNWFFITAGHVFIEIEKQKKAGYILDGWHFDDTGGWPRGERRIVPTFQMKNKDTVVWEAEMEYDYAAILIQPHYRKLLEANGKFPLLEKQWKLTEAPYLLSDPKAYCIVGYPVECIEQLDTRRIFEVNKATAFCEVVPLLESEVPEDFRRRTPTFYGKVSEEFFDEEEGITVKSLGGMSGGPIFELDFAENGELRSTVIAVQSGWYEQSRIIIGYPLIRFAAHLHHLLSTGFFD